MRAEPIRTDRLTLLPLAAEYADEMALVLSDPALHAFTGGAPSSAVDLRERYDRLVTGSPDPAIVWCNWVIRWDATGELTGTVQATASEDGTRAEIAWVVGTAWQGRGIATEAARGMVGWLAASGVEAVVAHIHPDHRASVAIASALGLAPTEEWHDGEVRWTAALA